jgi:hypothetical protein
MPELAVIINKNSFLLVKKIYLMDSKSLPFELIYGGR